MEIRYQHSGREMTAQEYIDREACIPQTYAGAIPTSEQTHRGDMRHASATAHVEQITRTARAWIEKNIGNATHLIRPDGSGTAIIAVRISLEKSDLSVIVNYRDAENAIPSSQFAAALMAGCKVE